MIVTIIGLGLIGGSIALGLRESGFTDNLIGVDNDPVHTAKALELGLVDRILPLEEAVRQSRIIVVATPRWRSSSCSGTPITRVVEPERRRGANTHGAGARGRPVRRVKWSSEARGSSCTSTRRRSTGSST